MIVTLICFYQETPRWHQTPATTSGATAPKYAGPQKLNIHLSFEVCAPACVPCPIVKLLLSLDEMYFLVLILMMLTARSPVENAEENPSSTKTKAEMKMESEGYPFSYWSIHLLKSMEYMHSS